MRIFLFFACFTLFLGCIQDGSTIPGVSYNIQVTTMSDTPLDSALVVIRSSKGDSISLTTGQDGRANFKTIEGTSNIIHVTRAGYFGIDTIDNVTVLDSTLEVTYRTIHVKLRNAVESSDTSNINISILILDTLTSIPIDSAIVFIHKNDSTRDTIITDDLGICSFLGTNQQYILSFRATGYLSKTSVVDLSEVYDSSHLLQIFLNPTPIEP